MNIYFVRHGETKKDCVFNSDGYPDAELTESGFIQAELTGKQLSKIRFDAIYSSDLRRAVQTAEIISRAQQALKVEIDIRIREIHMGVFHTSSEEQIRKNHPEFYEIFKEKETDFRYPEGESGGEALTRTLEFLNAIKSKKMDSICIVCHGGVIRCIMSHFLELPLHKRFNIHPNNCGISLVRYDDENSNFKVITINEISHLERYTTF